MLHQSTRSVRRLRWLRHRGTPHHELNPIQVEQQRQPMGTQRVKLGHDARVAGHPGGASSDRVGDRTSEVAHLQGERCDSDNVDGPN